MGDCWRPLHRPVRVGFLIDGQEAYGVLEYIRLLVANLDRTQVTCVGLFLGPGPATEAIRPVCDEAVVLLEESLLSLSDPKRSRWDLRVIAGKLVAAAVGTMRIAKEVRRRRIDIVDVNYYPLHLLAGLACKVSRRRCVWHWHGAFTRAGLNGWIARWGMKRLADAVPCISRFVRESLPAHLRPKACVVYNGVDIDHIAGTQESGALRRRLGISQGVKLVGVFGSISTIKGHDHFIHAAAIVAETTPDAHFVIVGDEAEAIRVRLGLRGKLERLADGMGMGGRVTFVGFLEESWRYMADCDVICLTSVQDGMAAEGFGLALAEAMAAGVAVVATSCGGPREIVEDGRSGLLVPPADAQALAAAVNRLLADGALRRDMARAGQERVCSCFSALRTTLGMQGIYAGLAAWRAARPSPAPSSGDRPATMHSISRKGAP